MALYWLIGIDYNGMLSFMRKSGNRNEKFRHTRVIEFQKYPKINILCLTSASAGIFLFLSLEAMDMKKPIATKLYTKTSQTA